MKLVNIKYFDPITIDDENPTVLVIENPILFRNIIIELNNQIANGIGEYVLSESINMLDVSKSILLITDIFNLGVSNRQIKTQLQQTIIKSLGNSDDNYLLINEINKFAYDVVEDFQYPISFKENLTITDFVKFCDFDFSFEGMDYLEKIVESLNIFYSFSKCKIIVVIGVLETLSEDESNQLYKMLSYRHIPILFIERSNVSEMKFKKYIIDSDLCLL